MKKLLSLLMALTMSIFVFTGCKGSNAPKEITDEELIKATIDGYASASASLDYNSVLGYVKKDTELYNQFKEAAYIIDMDYMIAQQLTLAFDVSDNEQLTENFETEIREALERLKLSLELSYGELKIEDNKATVVCTLIAPDTDTLFRPDDIAALVEEKSADKDYSAMSDDEKIDFVTDIVSEYMDSIDFSAAETTTATGEIELEKIDGKWLIIADK